MIHRWRVCRNWFIPSSRSENDLCPVVAEFRMLPIDQSDCSGFESELDQGLRKFTNGQISARSVTSSTAPPMSQAGVFATRPT
jgi:hypothetical protein